MNFWRHLCCLAISMASTLAAQDPATSENAQQVIQKLKTVEQSVGYKPTGNFTRTDVGTVAYYRCYFTGIRQLPETYNDLRMRKGTKDGCAIDEKKFDVFFYPVQAVATGHTPVTQSLGDAPPERVAAVVPHEDFHEQIHDLPDTVAEAAATLVGLATAGLAVEGVAADVDVFLQKAVLINGYFERLRRVYSAKNDQKRTFLDKQQLLAALQRECEAIRPEPRTFDKCASAPNNAGLAFDHTYTKYYPVLYQVFSACKRDLACTIQKIEGAPKKKPEAEVAAYFTALSSGSKP